MRHACGVTLLHVVLSMWRAAAGGCSWCGLPCANFVSKRTQVACRIHAADIAQDSREQALKRVYVPAPCREQIQHIQREPHSRLPENVPPGYHKHVGMVDELEEVHPMEGASSAVLCDWLLL